MDKQEINSLIGKYRDGRASGEEVERLNAWYRSTAYADGTYPDAEEAVHARMLGRLTADLGLPQRQDHTVQRPKVIGVRRMWPRVAVVAAAVAAITLGTWLYVNEIASSRKASRNDEVVMNDIAPGKQGATITLADGKVIQLSGSKSGVVISDELTYNDGTVISSSLLSSSSLRGRDSASRSNLPGRGPSTTQILTANTAKGQAYQITLPDGTRVWLNADTKISFPSQFIGRQRKVLLTNGEAYFEVTKNKTKPFIVESPGTNGRPGQQVTVLGTHFNISTYPDETTTKTTLLEGSVSVSSLLTSTARAELGSVSQLTSPSLRGKRSDEAISKGAAVYLKPNEQASLKGDALTITQIDPADILDWKNEEFVFNEQTITDIMRKVSRWYNINVVYTQNIDPKQTFSGKVSRTKKISEVLKIMASTGQVNFRIEGRTVYVNK
jgi:transmembrane sensor